MLICIAVVFYFLFPNNPLIIEDAPLLITELNAEVAARLAIFLPEVFVPPATVLTRFLETDLATDEAAAVVAF